MSNQTPEEMNEEFKELFAEPSDHWKLLAAFGVSMIGIALVIAFTTFLLTFLHRDNQVNSLSHLVETQNTQIAVLAAQIQVQTDTTACLRMFSTNRDKTRDKRDDLLSQALVHAIQREDVKPTTDLYVIAAQEATVAADAYNAYVLNPVLPCPIK